jgi:hypothetical protein
MVALDFRPQAFASRTAAESFETKAFRSVALELCLLTALRMASSG